VSADKGAVLVLDDDPAVREVVQRALRAAGYRVRTASDADEGFSILGKETIDALVLDVSLPGLSGLKFLELLRKEERTAALPVLMLTSRKTEDDKVAGLAGGADDYLTKPFSAKELCARVDALLRRTRRPAPVSRVLERSGIRVDLDGREVRVGSKRIELRPAEFDLLVHLIDHPGQVLTYQVLSEALSTGGRIMTSENLYSHAKNLRQSLGAAGGNIETVYGIGYKFRAAA
jgi:two-component system phosphate regulon response regulator PhoB